MQIHTWPHIQVWVIYWDRDRFLRYIILCDKNVDFYQKSCVKIFTPCTDKREKSYPLLKSRFNANFIFRPLPIFRVNSRNVSLQRVDSDFFLGQIKESFQIVPLIVLDNNNNNSDRNIDKHIVELNEEILRWSKEWSVGAEYVVL